jgi:hypothetical protein
MQLWITESGNPLAKSAKRCTAAVYKALGALSEEEEKAVGAIVKPHEEIE